MHNGHSQRRGKFFPLISAAFVDSRVLSSKLQAPSSPVQKVVVKHRWQLVGSLVGCWTSGQLAPKEDFSVCCIIKKSFLLFARVLLFCCCWFVFICFFFFCQRTGALHYFPFAIFNALSLRLKRHSCQRDLSSRPANRIGGRCWATSLSCLPFLRHILMGIICIMKIKNFMLVTHSPSVPR